MIKITANQMNNNRHETQDEALKVLLTEKKNSEYAHLDKSPAFKRSTPKY